MDFLWKPSKHTHICIHTCPCTAKLKLCMENREENMLNRCLITIPQPSEFSWVLIYFILEGGRWSWPFWPLAEMLIMTLAGQLKHQGLEWNERQIQSNCGFPWSSPWTSAPLTAIFAALSPIKLVPTTWACQEITMEHSLATWLMLPAYLSFWVIPDSDYTNHTDWSSGVILQWSNPLTM